MSDAPECIVCGACCFSELSTYVRVTGDDYARLGDAAHDLVHFDGNKAYMKMNDGHCAALELQTEPASFRCTTYATRPQVCRDLTRGAGECTAEREAKAERTQLAVLTARRVRRDEGEP